MAAAEAVPFIKTGGLADVIGSLPKELRKLGVDARVILPKHSEIAHQWRNKMVQIAECKVNVGWRQQYCGLWSLAHDEVPFYFIDNDYYFNRQGLYGFTDDAERYAYFSRSVLAAMPELDFWPDILHCHDWHAAAINLFLRDGSYGEQYRRLKTMFTIHNLQYQGVFPASVLTDVLAVGKEHFTPDGVEFYGGVNYMKAGLVYADCLTTVSCSYAHEIQTTSLGGGLDGLLRARQDNLCGIVNGIDYDEYNPATDGNIFVNYSADDINGKSINKARLQTYLGLPVRPDTPIIAIVARLVESKGLDLVAQVLDGLLAEDVQLVVLGTGNEKYESMFRVAAHRYPTKVSASLFFDETLAHKIYAGSDLFLMPSLFEPCGIGQLIALRYGSVPVVRETGGLKDTIHSYNEYTGHGNGFSFREYNAHDMLYTLRRAIGFYRRQEIWHVICANAMNSDYSWEQSARQYVDLYQQLQR